MEDNNSVSGSYTIVFKTGKKYHGKGDKARALKSAKQKANKYGDEFDEADIDWTPSSSHREAFKDEAKRIAKDRVGEYKDAKMRDIKSNYNEIESPGKKYLEQDGF